MDGRRQDRMRANGRNPRGFSDFNVSTRKYRLPEWRANADAQSTLDPRTTITTVDAWQQAICRRPSMTPKDGKRPNNTVGPTTHKIMNKPTKILIIFMLNWSKLFSISYEDYNYAEDLNLKSSNFVLQGKYDSALSLALDSIKIDGNVLRNTKAFHLAGIACQEKGDWSAAKKYYEDIVSSFNDDQDPRNFRYFNGIAVCCTRIGEYDLAQEYYKKAFIIHSDTLLKNNYAWLLATAPALSIRNSKLAVQLAKEAFEETEGGVDYILDTYASALAEDENFIMAIKIQNMAVKIVSEEKAISYRLRIKLYERKIKYRSNMKLDEIIKNLMDEGNKF